MARATPGLRKRGAYWHIDKTVAGVRIHESTGEAELEAAERYLAKRIHEIRANRVYGNRIDRKFETAAAKYIDDFGHKRSMDRDVCTLKSVMPYIGEFPISQVHIGTLKQFLADRKDAGISAGTLTRDLAVIRRVLNLCAKLWRDEQGRPWLDTAPLLSAIQGEKRKPRPITLDEQTKLMRELPDYLAEMVLFALHTGLRDQELCGLRWEDECIVSGTDATVFIITEESAKNGRERIVPLNTVARRIINSRRNGKGNGYVFTRPGSEEKLERLNNRAWRKAREAAGLKSVRVHDLRHTFGMRLRAAGVSFEDRQDLLGHHAGRITTHYSRAEIANLMGCVELLCGEGKKPEITLIRRAS